MYLGWVQHGEVVEISAADPELGGTFYVLPQKESEQPEIARETAHCLAVSWLNTHSQNAGSHGALRLY